MKKILLLLLIVILIAGSLGYYMFCNKPVGQPVLVTAILDGDGVLAQYIAEDGTPTSDEFVVRLYGIDAPERGQKHAEEATMALGKLIFPHMEQKHMLFLYEMDVDKRGRSVAVLRFPNGESVQAQLLRKGHVWLFTLYCLDSTLCDSWKKLEHEARLKNAGLWADDNPQPPWAWKPLHDSFEKPHSVQR